MDGILLIDKPTGITSHKVIEIIRRRLNIKKVGHAGTLDPLATGLLVIMLGRATKLSQRLISQFKTYEAEMKLFVETDTGDITGKIIKSERERVLTEKQVQNAIVRFNNYVYWQQPPLYSAIKLNGKKLYEYARKGLKIEVPARQVIIKSIKLINYDQRENTIKFRAECSKGTYIRSLVKDIAENLGSIATVSQLRRTGAGIFQVESAIKIEAVKKEKIIPWFEELISLI
jgi:tRNA pseudouridine55 synthase